MGGIIHHLLAGLICALIVFYLFKRKDYSIAIFLGNLLPDMVGAAYASIMIMSINPSVVLHSAPWFSLERNMVTQTFWIFLQVSFISLYLFYHVLSKKKPHHEFEGNLGLLLLGFVIHIIMDIFIIEQCIWY